MLSNSEFKIHTYNDKYCLNDVVIQCDMAKTPKYYINKVRPKEVINSQHYITKEKLLEILNSTKSIKGKELLKYINENNNKLQLVELENINTPKKVNFLDVGSNIIHFNNNIIKYFYHNQDIYFKAKDIAEILGYSDFSQSIRKHIDNNDKINVKIILDILTNNKGPVENTGHNNLDSNIKPVNFTGFESFNKSLVQYSDKNENIKIIKLIEKEDPKTVFINESGFHSLILSSKKPESKKFKYWVTSEVLPSIRKHGYYNLSNNNEYNMDKLDNYYNSNIVYIINVYDNIYKYGITSNIKNRFYDHKRLLKFNHIVKLYKVDNMTICMNSENKIKELTKKIKINTVYNNGVEFFSTNSNYIITDVIKMIDTIVDESNKEYTNHPNNKIHQNNIDKIIYKLDYIGNNMNPHISVDDNNIKLLIEKEKTKQLEIETNAKIKLLQLEIELIKEKNKSSVKKITNDTPKPEIILVNSSSVKKITNDTPKQEVKPQSITEKTKIPEESIIKKLPGNTNCIDCNKELISKKAIRCGPCERFKRLKTGIEMDNRPSYEQLNRDLKELKYVTSVAKKYNVSNLCIYKWIKNYEKYNTLVNKNQVGLPAEPTLLENVQKVSIIETPKKSIKQKIEKPEPQKKDNSKAEPPKVPTIKNASPNKQCIDCNINVYYKSIRCTKCLNKNKIKQGVEHGNRPTLEQLKKDLEELKSYVKVGIKYDVSDNTIRKWIKRYEDIIL